MTFIYNQYGRRWQLIGNDGNQQRTFEGFAPDSSDGLGINFKISKTSDTAPNEAEINVTNLSQENQDFFSERGMQVIFKAGYQESFGQIFKGGLSLSNHVREEKGRWLSELNARDGGTALTQAFISKTWKADTPVETIINALINQLTLPPEMKESLKQLNTIAKGQIKAQLAERAAQKLLAKKETTRQKVETIDQARARVAAQNARRDATAQQTKLLKELVTRGKVHKALDIVCRSYGLRFYVIDQVAYLGAATEPLSGEIIEVSPSSGLLLSPSRTEKGWRFRSYLNWRFNPGVPVFLNSRRVSGAHIIRRVDHSGSDENNEWYSDCEVTPYVQR